MKSNVSDKDVYISVNILINQYADDKAQYVVDMIEKQDGKI